MHVNDEQRHLLITEAAYFLAERRNFEPGHEHEDWLAAERQVDEMLKALAQQPALAQRHKTGELAKPANNADLATPAERTTTTLAEIAPHGKQALPQGRQVTESNQVPAMQAAVTSEANEQAKPARKAASSTAKAPARATTVKSKSTTGGRKAITAKKSVAAGAIPAEGMPQPASTTGAQPEVKAKTPAKRIRRSTKTEQPTPTLMAAASQEKGKPPRKPHQKKTETRTATNTDGRRRSKATIV